MLFLLSIRGFGLVGQHGEIPLFEFGVCADAVTVRWTATSRPIRRVGPACGWDGGGTFRRTPRGVLHPTHARPP